MKKIYYCGLLAVLMINLVVIPAMSNPISELKQNNTNIKVHEVRLYYLLKIDFSGKGTAYEEGKVVGFNLSECEGTVYALYSTNTDYERYFFKSFTITTPIAGYIVFLKGTFEYNPETESVEIHGSAIFGVTGPQNK
jgi:hypothetical protein